MISQKVESVGQLLVCASLTLLETVILCICSNLARVHHCGWGLNWSSEAVVLVTLVVSEFLDFFFCHAGSVEHHIIVYWLGSRSVGINIGHHVETEQILLVVLHNDIVDHGSWACVKDISVFVLEKSGWQLLVD